MEEIFKDIEEFEGFYKVSNFGRIISNRGGKSEWKEIKPIKQRDGYFKVKLLHNNKILSTGVHRLVAKAFIENPLGLPQVNHMNGNKADNRVDNLEWCTKLENGRHAVIHGLMQHGEARPNSKLTESDVLQIYKLMVIYNSSELGKMFNISRNTALLITKGKKWRYLYNQYFNKEIVERLDNQQPSPKCNREGSTTKEGLS